MELVPRSPDAGWSRLREQWIALPRHGNLLDAIEPIDVNESPGSTGVMLRYAAIDWWKPVLALDSKYAHSLAAAFGAQLAGVFELILDSVVWGEHGLFLQPFAHIDLDEELRVGFECGTSMRPPEMKLDERAFVFVVGRLWISMLETIPTDGIAKIIRRCVDINPRARFSTLRKVRDACLDISAPRGLRGDDRLETWYLIEEAIGWRAMNMRDIAYQRFQQALRGAHYSRIAWWGARDASEPRFIGPLLPRVPDHVPPPEPVAPPPPSIFRSPPMTPARASYVEGREHFLHRRLHEAQRCFASAISLDPMMLEAQLLRREVDRSLARVRGTTGTAAPQSIDVPASLREVRDIVIAGRIRDAIAMLSTDTYANNHDARLLLARLLALDAQYERAASVFASITEGPHRDEARLGLARVTIDRGKPDAALAILDEVLVTRSRDLGALEARARCLELLGRTSEASDAMKAFVAAVELASDARLARGT